MQPKRGKTRALGFAEGRDDEMLYRPFRGQLLGRSSNFYMTRWPVWAGLTDPEKTSVRVS